MKIIRYSPSIIANLTFFSLSFFSVKIAGFLSIYEQSTVIKWDNLYTAVFDWAAIQTGFVFGVYGFVIGSPSKFMQAIEETAVFKRFKLGIVTSLVAGSILTVLSLPLLIFPLKPFASGDVAKFLLFAWFALFIYALVSFFKTTYLFALMSRYKPSAGVKAA